MMTGITSTREVETEFLICGSGPAGAALACFLSEYGLRGIMIAASPSTADTPRAHITNMAALECLRDIGLDKACLEVASQSDCMEHTRWCHSMAGEEYGRIYSWGHDPKRAGDYDAASPCRHVDLPQTLLEPILVNHSKKQGWDVRFNNTLLTFTQNENGEIISQIRNSVSGETYSIRSRYLFGCDGARSQVVKELDLPLIRQPGGGVAINVLVDADLSHLIKHRVGNLHWTIQPEQENPDYSWMAIVRMVKPWTRWMFIIFPKNPEVDANSVSEAQWMEEVRRFIGDDSIPATIVNISTWKINEIVAERYSDGNVFCLGDAVHRHPPINGLGSNTCIQDAYNLAWKIAYVHKSLAHKSLLDSYSLERQPVGVGVVTRANQGFRDHLPIWNALGITRATVEERRSAYAELSSPSQRGIERRKNLRFAIEGTAKEFHAVGQEMNQRYISRAIVSSDEVNGDNNNQSTGPTPPPPLPRDPVLDHQITTYPGSRLPHAWLNTRIPSDQVSTIDLAGHTAFTLFTGIGGSDVWKRAAQVLSTELDIVVRTYSIGWRQDYVDVYSDWARRNEIEEDGCVLVRPDRFVCWRCPSISTSFLANSDGTSFVPPPSTSSSDSTAVCFVSTDISIDVVNEDKKERVAEAKLRSVLRRVLGWD